MQSKWSFLDPSRRDKHMALLNWNDKNFQNVYTKIQGSIYDKTQSTN